MILLSLAFQDVNKDKYNTLPSNELVQELALSVIQNNEAQIRQDSLNGFIAYLIENTNNTDFSKSDYRLSSAFVELNGNTPSRLYFQIDCKGRQLDFSTDTNIRLDSTNERIEIALENASIGKLKIPDLVTSYFLSNAQISDSLPDISVNDSVISVPSSYSVDVENFGTLINIDITKLEIRDNEVYIQTNPIVPDTLNNISDIISNKINSLTDWIGEGY